MVDGFSFFGPGSTQKTTIVAIMTTLFSTGDQAPGP